MLKTINVTCNHCNQHFYTKYTHAQNLFSITKFKAYGSQIRDGRYTKAEWNLEFCMAI